MALIKHKKYLPYDTYKGRAYRARIGFHSIRFPYFDDVVNWIVTTAVESQARLKDGEMIELKIWANESSWYGIPTYIWTVEWTYYMPGLGGGLVKPLAWQSIFYAVISFLTIIALVFLFKQIKEIIWGPGGEVRDGIINKLGELIMYGGLSFAGAYILINYIRKKK